ncbi:hypothetical protein O0I10_009283 [Lichtheimia ornata]|uniref:Uncharacterized protein n=1 Tax=Lichtheimia ornata TaxID=688661 RepID=A0AAD7UZP9_9FUNG|nr:uncharacterized protein O0I10_009283 [Lichtheimia ornata]KAJ8655076.1 hypothetical protein O0I10_009283 [Lichtheimia ornata]
MKTVQIGFINNRFDEQYTFELQGYLSMQDFRMAMHQINNAIAHHRRPGNKATCLSGLWIAWALIALAVYALTETLKRHHHDDLTLPVILLAPFLMVASAVSLYWHCRVIRVRFERAVLHACNTINATENTRGIHYRFGKRNNVGRYHPDVGMSSSSCYVILIEIDDHRFTDHHGNACFSKLQYHSKDFISIPLQIDEPRAAHLSGSAGDHGKKNNELEKTLFAPSSHSKHSLTLSLTDEKRALISPSSFH